MNLNEKILMGIVTCVICLFMNLKKPNNNEPKNVYQVYLDGQKIGLIANKDELLNMIDNEQQDIKDKYHVDTVYPPNGFEIEEYVTYDEDITSASKIYQKIQNSSDFTVEGYQIIITKKLIVKMNKSKKQFFKF